MQRNGYIFSLALTALVCATSIVKADSQDSAHMRNLDNRVTALEQRKGAGGMINPQGRPQVRDGADLFVFGNLLYWNAHENGLPISVKQADNTVGTDERLENSSVNNLKGKWNWGFRAGLGYNTPHDGWDLRLTWLRFTDTGVNTPASHSLNAFYPTQVIPSAMVENAYATSVSGYWSFNLNQLDLDLGREFFVSKWLTLRPHFGLRTDWLHQHVNANYYGLFDSVTKPDMAVFNKDRFWGMGVEGGLDTQWGLGGGWSLFGNVSGAIIYGLHEITVQNVQEKLADRSNATTFADLTNFYHVSHPILDFQLGLRWDVMFFNDRFHLGFDLGWEHHVYFAQNQFPRFTDGTASGVFAANQGDLTMQGWTFAARFDF